MEQASKKRMGIYAGRLSRPLGEEIASLLNEKLGEVRLVEFASGETYCRFDESVRDTDLFIIQTHCEPTNDTIMEMLIMIDAAKRASAEPLRPWFRILVMPAKIARLAPVSPSRPSSLPILLETAGANRVISVDLHSGQIQGFFDVPVDHLTAMPVIEEYIRNECDGRRGHCCSRCRSR